jgi:hypothetical protein
MVRHVMRRYRMRAVLAQRGVHQPIDAVSACFVLMNHDLDASVVRAAFSGRVVSHGPARAQPYRRDALRRDPA